MAETEDTDDITNTEEDETEEDSRSNNYHMEFRQHKRDYYMRKMGYAQVDGSVMKEQAEGYVRAIQWNLHYYYNGCMSWSWYYPHHFAPWITDIKDFSNMKIEFEMSKPFLPFEQLLAVLPAASKELLPQVIQIMVVKVTNILLYSFRFQVLQGLMINETSPIIDFYPKEFECDLNGKQQDWEVI